jgi:hypothetical protein
MPDGAPGPNKLHKGGFAVRGVRRLRCEPAATAISIRGSSVSVREGGESTAVAAILIKRAIGALWATVFVEGVFHIGCRYSANRPPIYHVLSGDTETLPLRSASVNWKALLHFIIV